MLAVAVPRSVRARRAALVAAVWAIGCVPLALGAARCTFAMLFHYPCPGCGMTRAITLLARGEVAESLRMHAVAVPMLAVNVALAVASIAVTYSAGSPLALLHSRAGKRLVYAAIAAYAATLLLYVARCFGLLGGPVPV